MIIIFNYINSDLYNCTQLMTRDANSILGQTYNYMSYKLLDAI